MSAHRRRCRRPNPGETWHLDDVWLPRRGPQHELWRAVDPEGNLLESLGQRRRDMQAAQRSCRKLLKGLADVPRVVITAHLKR
jgi:putative transposase